MYNRIQSLQIEAYHNAALSINNRIMRSPIDSLITSWEILPTSDLFSNQYRCKNEFLSISKIIINKLGRPTSVCMLAGTIIGASNWESMSLEQQYLALQHSAGVFEASSMTYLNIKGEDAENILNQLTPRDIQRFEPGEAKFVIFTTHEGTVDDDAMILKISEHEYLLSCGGSKLPHLALIYLPKVLEEFPNAIVSFPDIVSFNIKGPKRVEAMLQLINDDDKFKVSALSDFNFTQTKALNNDKVWIVKTKIGIEMWGSINTIEWAWQFMLDRKEIFTPCGWDILNSFRMECEEMLFSVYPLEIHDATTLWEIGCGWMTKEKTNYYIGKEALDKGKDKKIFELKKIQALSELTQTAKVGSILYNKNGDFAGYITSSAFSVKAERNLALAHILISNHKEFYLGSKDRWKLI